MKMWLMAMLCVACMVGCAVNPLAGLENQVPTGPALNWFKPVIFQQDYMILNLLAGLCSVLAVACVISRVFIPLVPVKSAWTCILCAAGCWLARLLLVKFLWVFAILAIIGLIAGGMAFAYGHRSWLEKRLNLDLNRDGKVGE